MSTQNTPEWPEFDDLSNDFMEQLLDRDFYNRARACVNLCAGSSDVAIKDITDALRAYNMTLDQYFLRSDSETQRMLKLLKEGKELLDAVTQQHDELLAAAQAVLADITDPAMRGVNERNVRGLKAAIAKAQGVV